ncbi:head-tail adaptor protein [uncultured Brevundimonas sp.]|uniref:phage head completion protein n=1 Tax=uncultured Brevundimonas sp. TaxID=213418 RepID=UPI0030EE46AE
MSGRRLAELLAATGTQTPQGGQAVSFEPLGWVWLRSGARRRRERTEAGMARTIETMRVETRADPRLVAGRVLRFDGDDWTVVAVEVDADRPGRVHPDLERRP